MSPELLFCFFLNSWKLKHYQQKRENAMLVVRAMPERRPNNDEGGVKTAATSVLMMVIEKVQRLPCRNDDKGGGQNGGNFDVDDGDKEGATTRVVVKTAATSMLLTLMAVKEWRDEEKTKFYHSNWTFFLSNSLVYHWLCIVYGNGFLENWLRWNQFCWCLVL